ncbi:MAG: metal-dependent hydrolase [Planctomycetota bacterium]|nr:metal-dependent hydrolase [Planctomycetota bacterium]
MAGFKTHITTSTTIGVVGALVARFGFGVPDETCVLAGGLCSISGMLPDLDSHSGVPLRESLAFAAAAIPAILARRFERMGMPFETRIMVCMVLYLVIRFGVAKLLKRFTVHRGMFHSIPAALIAGEVTYLVFEHDSPHLRYFIAGAVVVGFMSHLILDEIWSIGVRRGRIYFKSSSGTAIKFWGDSTWGNLSAYTKVLLLTWVVWQDPDWMARWENQRAERRNLAKSRSRERDKVDKSFDVSVDTPPPQASINPAPQPQPVTPSSTLPPYSPDQSIFSPNENPQPVSPLPGYQPPGTNGGFR